MFKPSYWIQKLFYVSIVSLAYFLLLRVEFLIWNFSSLRTSMSQELFKAFLWGTRFDLGAIALILAPIILISPLLSVIPRKGVRSKEQSSSQKSVSGISEDGVFIESGSLNAAGILIFIYLTGLQVPLWLVNGADIEFINFVGRRSTWDNLFLLLEAQGKWGVLFRSYWHLGGLCFVQALFYPYIIYKILASSSSESHLQKQNLYAFYTSKWGMRFRELGWYFGSLLVVILAARGGIQKKPMNLGSAQVFNHPLLNSMVLNSSFAIIKTAGASTLELPQYYKSEAELLAVLKGSDDVSLLGTNLRGAIIPPQTNVVVLILESFALEYMGKINGGGPYTPFLDELAEKGLFFTNAFANSRRSIEGIPAILASVPALMNEPFLTSSYVANHVRGFGQVFGEQGYYTAFFHGGMNGTMYFDSFAARAGFQDYFGANEYPNKADYDGTWGIFDEPFLQFAAEKLIQQQKQQPHRPFAISFFSLSSHHPYVVPEKYRGVFPTGELEILPTVAYTDLSVRNFFKTIEKQPWYENTLFVITADHAVKHFRESYKNELGDYRIPLIFYHPKIHWPEEINVRKPAQQIDILPTLQDAFGIPLSSRNYLAHSLFKKNSAQGITLFIEGKYLQVGENYYLRWTVDNQEVSLLRPQQKLVTPQESGYSENYRILLDQVKASRQYFNEGMLQNRILR